MLILCINAAEARYESQSAGIEKRSLNSTLKNNSLESIKYIDKIKAITDWPALERPHEKLIELGAQALSDAGLLAIFLRVGVTGNSAVDLVRDLLTQFGS